MSDFTVGDTLHFLFTTRQFSDGVPTVLAGTPVLGAFEDAVAAPITAGVSVTVSVNSVVGLNRANIVATGGNGFEAGKSYSIAITTGTVGGVSVVGEVVAAFSLGRAPALQPTTAGRTLDIAATGEVALDFGATIGTLDETQFGPGFITSAKIADNAFVAAAFAASSLNGKGDWNIGKTGYTAAPTAASITTGSFAAGAIDNAAFNVTETLTANPASGGIVAGSFGAGAIDAAAIAADAVTKLRSIVSGTADAGGTTTACRDAARTEIDDTFIGCWILFTSGVDQDRVRLITDFLAATDDIVFAPAVSVAVATGVTYEVLPAGGVDIQSWLATESGAVTPNALISGRVDSSTGAMAADVVTAAAIAANAIGASELATDAIGDAQVATGAIASTAFAAGAINAAAIATDAVDADALATDAVNEVARAVGIQTNTAFSDIPFLMVLTSDHVSPATGLTVTGERSINAGAFVGVSGSIAEISDGMYQFDADAADLNGVTITFRFSSATADDTFITLKTVT